jgi:phospholipid transport system substrate-binding protein
VKKNFALILLLVALPVLAATDPEQLIRQTADMVLAEFKANSETYQDNPSAVHELVEKVVIPHFDFAAMTDLALGKFKDDVSAEQKPAIVNEFRALLVRTYSSALLEYTDEKLVYLPMEGVESDGKVTVRTEIEQAGGFPIPINYSLLLGDDGWKVYDISVDDVSLVTNYRSSFARAIKKSGIDGLIKTMQERNQE